MTRQTVNFLCVLAFLAALGAAPAWAQERDATTTVEAAAAIELAALGDDAIPSDNYVNWFAALANPIPGDVSLAADTYDVYPVYLEQGEYYWFALDVLGAGDLDLYLYNPSATSLADTANLVKSSSVDQPDENVTGHAPSQGYYWLAVRAMSGASNYTLRGDIQASNDNIPGTALQFSPEATYLDSFSDWDDVYRVWLNAGDVLSAQLTLGDSYVGFNPKLLLFGPAATNVRAPGTEILSSQQLSFPKTISYTAPQAGVYYLDIYQSQHIPTRVMGTAVLNWTIDSPVYRFYNATNNTHFFTPSIDERNKVISVWSNVFTHEGIAYYTQPYRNTQPLYRFYNQRSASHFYTASIAEREIVRARWPHIFIYEGETYNVSPGGPQDAAVYRFYNMRNGSHFFTASAYERDVVIANWSNVYAYEGAVFYLHP